MSIRNPSLALTVMAEIVSKFEGFVMGVGNSNSVFAFSKGRLSSGEATTSAETIESDAIRDQIQTEEADALRKSVFTVLTDTSQGAYYTHDILNANVFLNSPGDTQTALLNVKDYLQVVTDRNLFAQSPNMMGVIVSESENKTSDNPVADSMSNASFSSSVRPHSTSNFSGNAADSAAPPAAVAIQTAADAGALAAAAISGDIPALATGVGESIASGVTPQERTPTGDEFLNKQSAITHPTLESPTCSSYIIKERSVSYETRRKNWLSIFFNAVSPIEMSRCTPYLEITVYHHDFSDFKEPFLSPVGYMRFDGGIDEKSGKVKPFAMTNKTYPLEETDMTQERISDVGYMNMFTSPQTMVNADINGSPQGLATMFSPKSISSDTVLDPFAPQATINSFTLTKTSMGLGEETDTRGTLTLTIHDRSRLRDFAPLVAINKFTKTSMKITYGWNHPDADITSNNDIGKFLNAMKSTQYYGLSNSDMRINGSSIEVTISVHNRGSQSIRDMPAAAGDHVPLRQARPLLENIIQRMVSKAKTNVRNVSEEEMGKVQPQLDVLLDSVGSTYSQVKTSEYQDLMKMNRENVDGNNDLAIIEKICHMLGIASQSDFLIQTLAKLQTEASGADPTAASPTARVNSAEVLRNKFETLIGKNKDGQLLQPDYYNKACLVRNAEQGKIDDNDPVNSTDFVSFGKCMSNFVIAPLAASGDFTEVQAYYYPLNNRCGAGRKHTTASLPVAISELRKLFEPSEAFKRSGGKRKVGAVEKGTCSALSMFELISGLTATTDFQAYGMTDITSKEKVDSIDAILNGQSKIKKDDCLAYYFDAFKDYKGIYDSSKGTPKGDEIEKAAVTKYVNEIPAASFVTRLREIYDNDGLPSADPSEFVVPEIRMSLETLPAMRPPDGGSIGDVNILEGLRPKEYVGQGQQGYQPNSKILRVHFFDAKSLGNETAGMAGSILYGGERPVAGDSTGPGGAFLANGISSMTDIELKEYIKRHYATIVYGSSTGVVKSINVSATTGDQVAQANYTAQSPHNRNQSAAKTPVNSTPEGVNIIPASIDVQMIGCPLIERMMKIFVDMGTNTDLDCLYTITSVTHTMTNSTFTTSLGLTNAMDGTVSNIRGNLTNKMANVTNPSKYTT